MDSIRNLPEEQPVLRNYSEELAKIIRSGISPRALKDRLSDYHQRDIAEVLEELYQLEDRVMERMGAALCQALVDSNAAFAQALADEVSHGA